MRDPFPAPLPLVRFFTPLARTLHLRTLPVHVHEILPAFSIYTFASLYIVPRLSTAFFPHTYPALNPRSKRNWDIHAVSLAQSVFICGLAVWVLYSDEERRAMDWRQRVWGYSGGVGCVQGFATGYFLWDLAVCAGDVGSFGWGALAHAGSALAVSLLGFRPFLNYYGLSFVLYELSTPFLNIHWFLDKLDLTGSQLQWYNGIALITSFGASRLVWGTYQSMLMYQDVWRAIQTPNELPVPTWLALAYLGSNTVLGVLNFYWFGKMINTVKSRFEGPKKDNRTDAEKNEQEAVEDSGVGQKDVLRTKSQD